MSSLNGKVGQDLRAGIRWVSSAMLLYALAVGGTLAEELASDASVIPADQSEPAFTRLLATWEAQRTEVVTADVDYWLYSQIPNGEWTREEFADLISRFDFVANPESLREFVPLIMGRPAFRDPPWGKGRIVVDGLKKRDRMAPFDNVQDGEYEYLGDADNLQLLIFELDRSSRYIRGIESLRWVPPTYINPRGFDIVTLNNDECRFVNRKDGSQLTVDPTNGMARHWLSYASPGELMLEVWQQGFASYDDGILLPQVQIEARYRNNRVTGFHVFIIRKAALNLPIAAEEFQVSANRLLKIFDYRNGVGTMVRLEAPTNNLRAQLPAVVSPPVPVDIHPAGRQVPWLFILNGLVLLIAGVLLWRSSPNPAPVQTEVDASSNRSSDAPPNSTDSSPR